MNKIFSLKRFGMLFKKHTIENYRGYLLSLFVLLGLLSISFGSVVYQSHQPVNTGNQLINYIVFMLLAGTIFTSNVFTNLGDKRKTIATLTLPASAFEKFMVGWVYSFLVFQVLFTAIFYGLIFLIAFFGNWPAGSVHYINIFSPLQKVYYVYLGYILLHSIVIYGAIYFKKMHFIKTAFAVFVIGLVIWLLNDQVLQLMIDHKISGNPPFSGLSFLDNHRYENVELGDTSYHLTIILFIVIAVIIWCASYFRLKEKQV